MKYQSLGGRLSDQVQPEFSESSVCVHGVFSNRDLLSTLEGQILIIFDVAFYINFRPILLSFINSPVFIRILKDRFERS